MEPRNATGRAPHYTSNSVRELVALVTRLFVIGVGIGATVAALIFVVALVIRLLI